MSNLRIIIILVLFSCLLAACEDDKKSASSWNQGAGTAPAEGYNAIESADSTVGIVQSDSGTSVPIGHDSGVQSSEDDISEDDTTEQIISQDDGESQEEQCTEEGALRCSDVGSRLRQKCTSSKWVTFESCPDGEVCDSEDSDEPGTCRAILDLCIGNEGSSVCDNQSMHKCSIDGIDRGGESCQSRRHCQAGVKNNACALCLPGEYRCVDASLEICSDDGQSWALDQTCSSAALCNDVVGDCTSEVCRPDSFACDGDVLMGCNDDQTAMVALEVCEADLCDEVGEQCDVCIPGESTCRRNYLLTCNVEGQDYDVERCDSGECRSGRCIECNDADDCDEPSNNCEDVSCNRFGECVYESTCQGDTPYCGDDGCAECLSDYHCSIPNRYLREMDEECIAARCVENECEVVARSRSTRCGRNDDWYCNGEGYCVECNRDRDCNQSYWQRFVCDDNSCVEGECTSSNDCEDGYECRGNDCVPIRECTSNSQCDTGYRCTNYECQMIGECVIEDDCSGDQVCTEDYECVDCIDDYDCSGDQVCTEDYECVDCIDDYDCNDGYECDQYNDCVPIGECVTEFDCDGDLQCNDEYECVECTLDEHCDDDEVCNDYYSCVIAIDCIDDDDCSNSQKCNEENACVDCIEDEDCNEDEVCDEYECVDDPTGPNSTLFEACSVDEDCSNGEYCVERIGMCTNSCSAGNVSQCSGHGYSDTVECSFSSYCYLDCTDNGEADCPPGASCVPSYGNYYYYCTY